jgi:hypothetical protein
MARHAMSSRFVGPIGSEPGNNFALATGWSLQRSPLHQRMRADTR